MDLLDVWVHLGLPADQVKEANLDLQVLLDLEDNLVNVGSQDYLVHKDHVDKMVAQVHLEQQAQLVPLVHKGQLGLPGQVDLEESRAQEEN